MNKHHVAYKTDYGTMECYHNYLVFNLTSVVITSVIAKEILVFANNYYGQKPYVFISNRAFSSDIDPKAYESIDHEVMVGIAIVSEMIAVKNDAVQEQLLYKGAFSFFKTVEQAVGWAKTVVKS